MPGSCRPCMLQRLKASELPEDTTHLGHGPACVTLQPACSRGGDCCSPGPPWGGMCALVVLCTPQRVAGSCQLSAFEQQEQLRWQPGLICRTGMLCLGIGIDVAELTAVTPRPAALPDFGLHGCSKQTLLLPCMGLPVQCRCQGRPAGLSVFVAVCSALVQRGAATCS